MMRGLVIATNGDMRVQTFTDPEQKDLQAVVGRLTETVPVYNIEGHYKMRVDQDARLQWPKPTVNEVACFLARDKSSAMWCLPAPTARNLACPMTSLTLWVRLSWQRCRDGADGRMKHDPLTEKAMQFVCLALMLVVLMAVVSVADGSMPLLNGVILFISCLLGVNTCLGIWFKLDDKERGRRE